MTDVKIRELEEKDLANGFLESLDALRKASNLDPKKAKEILKTIKENPNYVIYVAEIDSKIVGTTTLLIEQKFIHNGGLVGHIEDVAVRKEYQGKGIGQKLVKALLEHAKRKGCYKTILDCTDDLVPFYEEIGFSRHSNSMRVDH
jgi:glucosamine-phosphate N-acetyltransferase